MDTIESGRIRIGACDEAGKAELVGILSDRRVCELYFAGGSRAGIQAKVGEWGLQDHTGLFTVRERASGNVIGCIELVASHLSYFVAPVRWGQGYGSEMVTVFLAQLWALRESNVMYTTVVRENIASRRILEKAGFDFSGICLACSAAPAQTLLEYVYRVPA